MYTRMKNNFQRYQQRAKMWLGNTNWSLISKTLATASNIALVLVGIYFAFQATPNESFKRNLRIKGEGLVLDNVFLDPTYASMCLTDDFCNKFLITAEVFNYGDSEVFVSRIVVSSSDKNCPIQSLEIISVDPRQISSSLQDKLISIKPGEKKKLKTSDVIYIPNLTDFTSKNGIKSVDYIHFKNNNYYSLANSGAFDKYAKFIGETCVGDPIYRFDIYSYQNNLLKNTIVKLSKPKFTISKNIYGFQFNDLLGNIASINDLKEERNILNRK